MVREEEGSKVLSLCIAALTNKNRTLQDQVKSLQRANTALELAKQSQEEEFTDQESAHTQLLAELSAKNSELEAHV